MLSLCKASNWPVAAYSYMRDCPGWTTCSSKIQLVLISCRRAADKICLRPLQVDNILVFIRQVAPVPACWNQQVVDLSPFDLESGFRVTCDVIRSLCQF